MLFDASPWVALGCIGLLLLVTGADAERRGWAIAAVATLALFLGLRLLPALVPGERVIGNLWDWSGPLLGLAGVLIIAAVLVRRGLLDWRDAGITLRQAPGSVPVAVGLIIATLGINYASMSLSTFRLPGVPLETWLYQATLPGLVEETLFRGVLLAMADRAVRRAGPRWRWWVHASAMAGWRSPARSSPAWPVARCLARAARRAAVPVAARAHRLAAAADRCAQPVERQRVRRPSVVPTHTD
jgi:membrane protease YdiL (CAAX protease family)